MKEFDYLDCEGYSKEGIEAMAHAAMAYLEDYVGGAIVQYSMREQWRQEKGLHTVCILGHGHSGKDVAGKHLGDHSDLVYAGSISEFILPLVAYAMKAEEDHVWNTRRDNRAFWYNFCSAIRRKDASMLVKIVLGQADIVTGIRDWSEFTQCKSEGVIEHIVWINRLNIEVDPTMGYDAGDVIRNTSHVNLGWIDNNKDLDHLLSETLHVARGFGIPIH